MIRIKNNTTELIFVAYENYIIEIHKEKIKLKSAEVSLETETENIKEIYKYKKELIIKFCKFYNNYNDEDVVIIFDTYKDAVKARDFINSCLKKEE